MTDVASIPKASELANLSVSGIGRAEIDCEVAGQGSALLVEVVLVVRLPVAGDLHQVVS